ncbi:MAG: putative toxin-antitoxin system toxin component, PIN family [Selenomonadaceae bacterium]|nr:putative toxin-antitoxin system toxin component, PIN family [Selenomonadaceae bacterium]MBP3722644.1 putative toxin-antitoxin system toxin component, PIN family [Selenomonadaceae bacterium]
MRVLIDTNVLISAVLHGGIPLKAYNKAVSYPNFGVLCVQNINELRRVFNRKFPKKVSDMEKFLALAMQYIEIIDTPETEVEDEGKIRDDDDKTILRAAIFARVDIILTGDRDLLESDIENPKIVTPANFLEQ